jgi:toxin ParE1/3/4
MQAAEVDLIAIYLHGVENFGVGHAEAYQDKIDLSVELTAIDPKIARLRQEIQPPVRIHSVGVHIIVCLDPKNAFRILRIQHQRDDWATLPLG